MTNDQREIEGLLTRRIGLDPVSMGPHLIVGAARRRMAELGLVDLGEYAAHVLGSEAEQQALIEEVVVPESWFFRDDRPFRWLASLPPAQWPRSNCPERSSPGYPPTGSRFLAFLPPESWWAIRSALRRALRRRDLRPASLWAF